MFEVFIETTRTGEAMKRTIRYSREEASSRREARLLRSLHHRNVISFLGEMVTRTAHVIFLELAAAGSVEHILHRFGRFNDNRKPKDAHQNKITSIKLVASKFKIFRNQVHGNASHQGTGIYAQRTEHRPFVS